MTEDRNKPGYTDKKITYDVRNVPEGCDKYIKLREEEEEKSQAKES